MAEPKLMMAPVVLAVPLDPEQLNRMMQANSPRLMNKWLKIPTYRLAFAIPANTTVEIPFPLPKGWVCTRRSPLIFQSYFHDENVLIDVWVDDRKVNEYPLPLTADFELDFGQYYVKRVEVRIIVTNNTSTSFTLTVHVTAHLIKETYYNDWYDPIIEAGYDALTKLAEWRRYVRELPPLVPLREVETRA